MSLIRKAQKFIRPIVERWVGRDKQHTGMIDAPNIPDKRLSGTHTDHSRLVSPLYLWVMRTLRSRHYASTERRYKVF